MKRTVAVGVAVVVVLAGGGVAVAQGEGTPSEAGSPASAEAEAEAEDDACTSFFNGKKKGHGKGGRPHPAPVQAMLDAAGGDPAEVLERCGGPDAIGGNPAKGRFLDLFD